MKSFIFIIFIFFVGCEENQTTINDFAVPSFVGHISPSIGGILYTTSSGVEGITDQSGEFTYNINDNITFEIGNVILGMVNSNIIGVDKKLSLFDLLGFKEHNNKDKKYIMIWQFLFSLSSKISEGVIFIPEQIRGILKVKLPSKININTLNQEKLKQIITNKAMLNRHWIEENIIMEYFYNPQNIWWQFSEGLVVGAKVRAYEVNPKTLTKELLFTEKTLPSKYSDKTAKFYPHLNELKSDKLYLFQLNDGYLSDSNYDGLIDRNITIKKNSNIYYRYQISHNNNQYKIKNKNQINLFFKGGWFNKQETFKITSTANILHKYFTYSYCLNNINLCKNLLDTWSRQILTHDINNDEKISSEDFYIFNSYVDWDKSSKKFDIQKYNKLQNFAKNDEKEQLFNMILFDLVFLSSFEFKDEAVKFSLFSNYGDYIFLNQTNSIDIVDFNDYYNPYIMYSIDSFVESVDLDMYYRKENKNKTKPEISKLLFSDATGVLQVYDAKDNKFGVTDRIFTNKKIYQSFFVNNASEIIYFHETGMTMIQVHGNQKKSIDYLNHTIPSQMKIADFNLSETDVVNSILLKFGKQRAIFVLSSGSNGLKIIRTWDDAFTAAKIMHRTPRLKLVLQKAYFENPKHAQFNKDQTKLYVLSNLGIDIFEISTSGRSNIRVDQLETEQAVNTEINRAKSFILLNNKNKFVFLTEDNKLQFYIMNDDNHFMKVGHFLQLPDTYSGMKLSVDKSRLFLFSSKDILVLDLDLLEYFTFYSRNNLDKVDF